MSRIDHRQRKIPKAPAAAACGASDGSNLRLPRHVPQSEAMQPMAIEPMPVASLRPHPGNARTHSKKQIRQVAASIREFGFNNPVLIGEDGEIIAGHGRVEAAKLLGLDSVPTVRLAHLNAAQRRAYVLADNKLALNAGWDRELLAIELQGLIDVDFDVELTGFSPTEIDLVLDEAREGSPNGPTEAEDQVPFPITDQTSAVKAASLR
jgi:ParB-like chromosome segregation protein Spo0J